MKHAEILKDLRDAIQASDDYDKLLAATKKRFAALNKKYSLNVEYWSTTIKELKLKHAEAILEDTP